MQSTQSVYQKKTTGTISTHHSDSLMW